MATTKQTKQVKTDNLNLKISQLSDIQRAAVAYRLGCFTECKVTTALEIIQLKHGDLSLNDTFTKFGQCVPRSVKINVTKALKFTPVTE